MHHRDIMWLMPKTGTNKSLFPEQGATAAKPASRLHTDCIGDQFAKGWLHSPSWTLKVWDFSQVSLALALVFPYMLCKSPQKIRMKLASKLADSNPCKVWHHKWHKEVRKSTYSIKLPMAGWCMTRAMWILMAAPWRQRSQPHNFKKHRPAQYICLTFTVFLRFRENFYGGQTEQLKRRAQIPCIGTSVSLTCFWSRFWWKSICSIWSYEIECFEEIDDISNIVRALLTWRFQCSNEAPESRPRLLNSLKQNQTKIFNRNQWDVLNFPSRRFRSLPVWFKAMADMWQRHPRIWKPASSPNPNTPVLHTNLDFRVVKLKAD